MTPTLTFILASSILPPTAELYLLSIYFHSSVYLSVYFCSNPSMKSAAPGESSGGVGSAVGAIGSQRLNPILDLTEAGGGVSWERFLFTSDSLNGTRKTIVVNGTQHCPSMDINFTAIQCNNLQCGNRRGTLYMVFNQGQIE